MPRAQKRSLSFDLPTYELLAAIAREEQRSLIVVLRRALALYTASTRSN